MKHWQNELIAGIVKPEINHSSAFVNTGDLTRAEILGLIGRVNRSAIGPFAAETLVVDSIDPRIGGTTTKISYTPNGWNTKSLPGGGTERFYFRGRDLFAATDFEVIPDAGKSTLAKSA